MIFSDTDEIVVQDSSHYDYGVPNYSPKTNPVKNTLNIINSVLLRKTAINKLTRYGCLNFYMPVVL